MGSIIGRRIMNITMKRVIVRRNKERVFLLEILMILVKIKVNFGYFSSKEKNKIEYFFRRKT